MSNQAQRYGTPSGNVWVVRDVNGSVACAPSKDEASARLRETNHGPVDVQLDWSMPFASKQPMLIMGANAWLRERAPFALVQRFDVHLVFVPSPARAAWTVGAWLLSRDNSKAPLYVSVSGHRDIQAAMSDLVCHLVLGLQSEVKETERLSVWLQNWIYRLPKIALKDVLSLEPYQKESAE